MAEPNLRGYDVKEGRNACDSTDDIPAKAGTQDTLIECTRKIAWIPACAGMTVWGSGLAED